ncbi:exported hypothetical protein [Candidatus Sulfotelmatobacter kueseliae]|uniref:Uncharacterized protein n=1 Tax=Candidatus Sulfotelmatobacter kueseliae TaxID=2042962 RepID=A0A2U3KF44_9BACT|nr:exported hypothetical protein [Candidatus Sulfotelmatobacter kueseliae]
MRRLTLLFVTFVWTAVLFAQKKQPQVPPQKQLSPTEKQWCPVIESSLAGTADLQPVMRSLVLDMIAGSLKKCDPPAVRRVLIDAFLNTLAIPDTEEGLKQQSRAHTGFDQRMRVSLANLEAKRTLQTDSLTHLLAEDERKAESLLPQAEPGVRTELLYQMISKAVAAKKLDQALNLLEQSPPEGFPYGEATNLMLELPPADEAEKQEIFGWAMAADHERHSLVVGGDDFGSMIVRFWEHLAPAVVLQAISQVLDGAQSSKSGISLGSGSNRGSFNSEYQYRVFEFLPILRELDSDQADRLLHDSPEAQAQLKDFPNGIQSLNPAIRDTPLRAGEEASTEGMVGMGNIAPMLQQAKITEAYESRIAEIVRVAESNPKQAIEMASGLPSSADMLAPRAEALLKIAGVAKTRNPLAARDALEGMSESLRNVEPTGQSGPRDYWAEGIDIAIKVREIDLAKKLLKEGMSQVDKLKSKDTDSDDPNLAFKAWWPSTAMLSGLIMAASRISSQTALDATQEASDPEVRLLCQVRLANRQLGARIGRSVVMMNRKQSTWGEYGTVEE